MIDNKSLENEEYLFLNRRSNHTHENTFDDNGLLRQSAITRDEYPKMSLNLLGFYFKSGHSKFIPTNSKNWTGEFVSYYKNMNNFNIATQFCNIFLPFRDLQNKLVKYIIPFDISLDPEHKAFINQNNLKKENSEYSFEGKIEVEHKPTFMNYWHFELKLTNQFKEVNNAKSQVSHRYIDSLVEQIIIVSAISQANEINLVKSHSDVYKK